MKKAMFLGALCGLFILSGTAAFGLDLKYQLNGFPRTEAQEEINVL